jgi:8-oxo-dGTP pyrophosphatase MutT (NUDIX family)
MTLTSIDVEEVTRNQPFCAGVVLIRNDKILVTLNNDLPEKQQGIFLRVGGVGGGQEIGETIVECALREAKEELETDLVRLISSDVTFFHDMDTDEIVQIHAADPIAPYLLQRVTSRTPDKPYKAGLPFGPYLYFGIYLCETSESHLRPGDDVDALLDVPLGKWDFLLDQPTLASLLENGFILYEQRELNRNTQLVVPENESFLTVVKLMKRNFSAPKQ